VKFLSSLAIVLALGLSLVTVDAEAKRLGGGKSSGMQRQTTTQKAPDATPAQNPGTAAAAPAAAPKRSWMGPLAGLAAGLGLAALASHFGFGDELASMMMIGLAVMAVMVVIGIIMRKRAAARQPLASGTAGMQYAGAPAGAGGAGQVSKPYDVAMPGSSIGSAIGSNLRQSNIPADFDVPGFVRNAKVQFIRLQAANDAGNLEDIRQFTTPEMFAEIQMDIAEHVAAEQQTEVVSVEADVIEVLQEPTRYVVSVRFSGLMREGKGAQAAPFDEMWHLVKSRAGTQGWLLSGIQQSQ